MDRRILITGNGGSGKTWLGRQISSRTGLPLTSLDDVYWMAGYGGVGRPKEDVFREVEALAGNDAWVIEGVYGWLLPAALPRATAFVFIDLPVGDCLASLRSRGKQQGESDAAFQSLLDWEAEYPNRTNLNSRLAHRRLWDEFEGPKEILTSRGDVDRYASLPIG